MRRLLLTVTTVLNLSTHPELNFLSAKQPSSFVSHLGLKERLQFSIQHQLPFCICVVFSQFDQTRRDKTKQKFRFTECWKSIYVHADRSSGQQVPLYYNGNFLVFLRLVFFPLFMEAAQLTALSVPQLISLLLALVCEITRRLNTPIELGATIGEAEDVNIDMPAAETPSTSTSHPWQTTTPVPGTPTGPAPQSQCLYICGVADCDMLCAAQCHHGYHRCDHHWWG